MEGSSGEAVFVSRDVKRDVWDAGVICVGKSSRGMGALEQCTDPQKMLGASYSPSDHSLKGCNFVLRWR